MLPCQTNLFTHTSFSNRILLRLSSSLVLFILLILLINISVFGQASNSTNSRTPLALAPGSPAGSYNLSGFESVNLFNGNLNFSLPLLNVGGRGNAGYTLTLPIEHKWSVDHNQEFGLHTPRYEWWTSTKPGYGPGILQARQTMSGCGSYGTPTETRTNLTFTTPDGSEIELKDTIAYGEPQGGTCPYNYPANGALRGTVLSPKTALLLLLFLIRQFMI